MECGGAVTRASREASERIERAGVASDSNRARKGQDFKIRARATPVYRQARLKRTEQSALPRTESVQQESLVGIHRRNVMHQLARREIDGDRVMGVFAAPVSDAG